MRILSMMVVSTVFALGMTVSHAPAQMFVFPQQGQSPDQQELDEFTCHK
jgi:hypothetical protein